MLLNDENPAITYVNAGHSAPFLISGKNVRKLEAGGMLLGFNDSGIYQEETVPLRSGDIVCAFTDGVFEAENSRGEEFGEQAISDFLIAHKQLPASELSDGLYKKIKDFSRNKKFRDDFTILIVKVR
jgi:sigma-B regulation protein RsbU (phosphoserine phosphatase)